MEVPWENVAEAALKERKARVASDKTSYTDTSTGSSQREMEFREGQETFPSATWERGGIRAPSTMIDLPGRFSYARALDS